MDISTQLLGLHSTPGLPLEAYRMGKARRIESLASRPVVPICLRAFLLFFSVSYKLFPSV